MASLRKLTFAVAVTITTLLLLFVIGYAATMGDYPVAKTTAEDTDLPVIEIDGYRFHAESFGDPAQPLVIAVHGGPGWDYRTMLPLQALADDFQVVFFDQRGSGLSPRVAAEQINLDTALADLDAMVERFGHSRPVILVGHSWGAMLVSGYLGRYPDKVDRAVLMEPGFLNTEMLERTDLRMGPMWEAGYLAFALKRWFESLHIDAPDEQAAADYFIGEVAARANPEYYCNDTIPAAAISHWRAGAVAMQAMFAKSRDSEGRLSFDFTTGLEHFTRPVLLLASECNDFIGLKQQQAHAAYFPHHRLELIPASGHMMLVENPSVTLGVIRRFLTSNSVSQGEVSGVEKPTKTPPYIPTSTVNQ